MSVAESKPREVKVQYLLVDMSNWGLNILIRSYSLETQELGNPVWY